VNFYGNFSCTSSISKVFVFTPEKPFHKAFRILPTWQKVGPERWISGEQTSISSKICLKEPYGIWL